ncbi:hypothetical protein GGTG_01770 [Gaeumannomyces tritici R3-111a-1]|uniref:DUF7924 domain-containing protein n=1 Tax=Gaeumannomyces tritici (strain R3-111a-1) TaxID=644352 RepID=J3NKH8_GAET3|nr:hypothetical protein GGTG_01770 [Gaeumannomyces tritici R3-111a-1]EJT81795.1 hypothetical protein GGTG_01770 [Gaeumannomyces tritici R3-111a-1]
MARAGAQTAAQERPPSSAPKIQGEQPLGIQSRKSPTRKRDRIQEQPARKRKQSIDAPQYGSDDPGQKRQRTPHTPPAGSTFNELLIGDDDPDPIAFWAKEQHWPEGLFKPATMERLLMRKKSSSGLSRKRSNSVASTTAASDQKPRAEKSAPYKNAQYSLLLQTKGSYMKMSELGITDASKTLVQDLLNGEQPLPNGTHFDDDIFVDACQNLENTNEARVIQDISRLIVPSAESHALRNKSCKHLIESVNAGWNNSIPLTGTRPQPDYCVGFRREAFTEDQLAKLEPIIGNFLSGDQSFVMATYSMHFPFLTCEVKCCAETLDTADRQNAHSMTLAVRAIVELFRLVKRESEVHRQILAFSISHDHRAVRIYGHYPIIAGENTTYYRHPIRTFDFTELDGKNKWAAYRFTKNVYDTWTPAHFKNICSAIEQLPLGLDFDVPPLPEATTELSRELGSSIQSDAGSLLNPVEQDVQSSNAGRQGPTPDTLYTGPGVTKRRKG